MRVLSDLYVRGKEILIDDGAGDPIKIWVQKLNPVENERAIRYANIARSRWKSLSSRPDSEEYLEILTYIDDAFPDRESKVRFVISDEVSRARQSAEAEIASEEEWEKDNYLIGLVDAWENELKEMFIKEPEDAEAIRVHDELDRYSKLVEQAVETFEKSLMREYESMDEASLHEKAIERWIQSQAEYRWFMEFRKCQLWLSVRDPDHHEKLLLEDRHDVDSLAQEVVDRLTAEYESVIVPISVGKD
jgi:hypothetical protein